jgi:acyl-CoA dehydrogenase
MTATTEAEDARLDRFVELAAQVGRKFEKYAAGHDRDGTFVDEAFDVLRSSGYLALAVPTALGGLGATIGQTAFAQAEMARYDASAALAVSMHLHITLFGAWRYRREMPGADALLRRVVEERIVLVSTGGSDFTRPNGTATKVDGGFRVNAHKIFSSQVPVGDVFSTMFVYEDPEAGRQVLMAGVPVRSEGVTIIENWDTMGMRGTGSHDVQMDDVFVADAQVSARRPWGVLDPPFMIVIQNAMPVVSAVYLGVAEAARDRVIEMARGSSKAADPAVQRLVGLLDYKLRVARWALCGALQEIGDDPVPSMDKVVVAMQAKRAIAQEAVSACDVAMEVLGGASYFRKLGIEQAARDVRGVMFHPLTPELTLFHAGKVALGLPADEM